MTRTDKTRQLGKLSCQSAHVTFLVRFCQEKLPSARRSTGKGLLPVKSVWRGDLKAVCWSVVRLVRLKVFVSKNNHAVFNNEMERAVMKSYVEVRALFAYSTNRGDR